MQIVQPDKKENIMSDYRFRLQPYKGISTRHTCPECNQKRCFTRYIDTEGKIEFPPFVGRCDHEQRCGYHYTPSDYFHDHPLAPEQQPENQKPIFIRRATEHPKPTSFIPMEVVEASMQHYEGNNLFRFLSLKFGREQTMELMKKYYVGTSRHWQGSTVFWQVDKDGRARTGKIILYNPQTGKRVKQPFCHVTWVHSALRLQDFNLRQCFFGEHLLASDKSRPVALVESEKTALVCSTHLPQFVWLASGGKNGCLNDECLRVLSGRTVSLFPDLGATDYWRSKIPIMKQSGIDARMYDYLERCATDEQRKQGLDIADFLLDIETEEGWFEQLRRTNQSVDKLANWLRLQPVETSVARQTDCHAVSTVSQQSDYSEQGQWATFWG